MRNITLLQYSSQAHYLSKLTCLKVKSNKFRPLTCKQKGYGEGYSENVWSDMPKANGHLIHQSRYCQLIILDKI